MKKVVAGVDIGGTNTVFGIVDNEGKVLAEGHLKTTDYPVVTDFVKAFSAALKKLIATKKDIELTGIGIGAPDANFHRGTIEHAPNLAWKGIVPLGDLVKKELNVQVAVTNDANAAAMGEMVFGGAKGMKDFIILTLKAHAITGVIEALQPLVGPHTAILFAQNGIPWWYFYKSGGPFDGHRLQSVDPGGAIWDRIGPERALGCVVWQAAEIEAPGVISHHYGDRMPIGEPSGERTARVQTLSRLLTAAGIKSQIKPNLRNEIWLKLWGNLTFNPISALSRATLVDICQYPPTRALAAAMMAEAQAVATKLGITFRVTIDKRIAGAEKVGKHKTSMLQDIEAGREPEIEALVGSVVELGQLTGTPTPHIDSVYALVKLLAASIAAEAQARG